MDETHPKPSLYPCLSTSPDCSRKAMNDNGIKSTEDKHLHQHGSSTWLKASSAFLPVRQRAQLPCNDPCSASVPTAENHKMNYATFGVDHQAFPTLKPAPGSAESPHVVVQQSDDPLEQTDKNKTTERPNKTAYETKLAETRDVMLCWGYANKEAS